MVNEKELSDKLGEGAILKGASTKKRTSYMGRVLREMANASYRGPFSQGMGGGYFPPYM